jgi:hypothetical protein
VRIGIGAKQVNDDLQFSATIYGLGGAALATLAEAQIPETMMKRAVRRAEPTAIPLYRGTVPGSESAANVRRTRL